MPVGDKIPTTHDFIPLQKAEVAGGAGWCGRLRLAEWLRLTRHVMHQRRTSFVSGFHM